MSFYLGFMEERNNFFNFRPIKRVAFQGEDPVLYDIDIEEVLPESQKNNINFYYDRYKEEINGAIHKDCRPDSLKLFDFTIDDLEDNTDMTGERNPTGYKVSYRKIVESGKLVDPSKFGWFQLIKADQFGIDLTKDIKNVEIGDFQSIFTDFVVVQQRIDSKMALFGPFKVRQRAYDEMAYITPALVENSFVLYGKVASSKMFIDVEFKDRWNDFEWPLVRLSEDAESVFFDTIDDETLFSDFITIIENQTEEKGKIKVEELGTLVQSYNQSLVTSDSVPEPIRVARINKITSLFESESVVEESLKKVSDSLFKLFSKYQESQEVDSFVESLLERHPEMFEGLRESKVLEARWAETSQKIDQLQHYKEELESSVKSLQEKVTETQTAAENLQEDKLVEINTEYAKIKNEYESVSKDLQSIYDLKRLDDERKRLEILVDESRKKKEDYNTSLKTLERELDQKFTDYRSNMVSIAFDGFLSSKMLESAAKWETDQEEDSYLLVAQAVNTTDFFVVNEEELLDYLVPMIQSVRPQYSYNCIVNIAICAFQNFLTVFSGDPGSGKTSICNILATTLGLNSIDEYVPQYRSDISSKRFVSVSVEQGWTSKRDFIGYFNPLSKSFDKNNKQVYDALKLLDKEAGLGYKKFPYLILLDEANLSPMEYYWADFMNICDDLNENSVINLGEDNLFIIPETLHFLATINNDDTTTQLSPRLIDRSWIITLPSVTDDEIPELDESRIKPVAWSAIKSILIGAQNAMFKSDISEAYDTILKHFRKMKINVSPRTNNAVRKYWSVASSLFKQENETEPDYIALDYAIAQRLLPKINGSGDDYENWLIELKNIADNYSLNLTASILDDIITKGNEQLKYYQFF